MISVSAILDPGEVTAMFDALSAVHLRYGLLWLMGCESGLRIGDLLNLRVSDLMGLADGLLLLKLLERKTGKFREVSFSATALGMFWALKAGSRLGHDDFVFFSSDRCKFRPITRQWAHKLIALTARNLRLECVGTHSMRKTFACNLYRATGSLKCVQEVLNHKYPSTTLLYLSDLLTASVPVPR
jgi:integrase